MPLVTPSSEMASVDNNKCDNDNGKVQMKKQLGLTEGTAIILGIIFGSGKNETKYILLKSDVLRHFNEFIHVFFRQEFLYHRKVSYGRWMRLEHRL